MNSQKLLDKLLDGFKKEIDVYYAKYLKDMRLIIDSTLNNIDGKYDPSNYMHRSELDVMHSNIESKIDELFDEVDKAMENLLTKAYTESYNYYGDSNKDTILFNTKMQEALDSLWSGMNYKDRLKKHRFLLKFQSNAVANNGIVKHESNKKIKTELSKIVSSQYSAMKNLSTTEVTVIGNQATIDYCNANNILEVVVIDDDRCCQRCRDNAGRKIRVRDYDPSMVTLHPHCRCYTKPVHKLK